MKYGKTDANQAEIVKALEQVGCSVFVSSDTGRGFPDLVCGFRGRAFLLEVKTDSGDLNERQRKFHASWNGHIAVVRNVDEALRAIGAI